MRSGSLFRRLFAPIAAAVVVLTVLVTGLGAMFMRKAVVERARGRAAALAPATRDHIGWAMRLGDHRHLGSVIEELGRNSDLGALRVLRPDGIITASSHPSEVGVRADADHRKQANPAGDLLGGRFWTPRMLHSVWALENDASCRNCHGRDTSVIGYLDLDVAVPAHLTGLATFGSLSVLLGALYLVAMIAIVVPVIGFVVVRPLGRVIAAFRRLEQGDLATRVAPTGTRQIDDVISGFNRMAEQLEQAWESEKDKRRLEQERAQQLACVGQLAAGLAHEFRNPLSSVKGVVEALAVEAAADDPYADVLRAAAGELDRIDQIMKDLLQYARPRPPVRAAFDLNAVAGDVAALAFPTFTARAPRVSLALAAGLPDVLGDPDMVRQVLINLLLNASQAAPEHEATSIALATGSGGRFAWCRVTDDGPGVPREAATTIFQPFVTTKARGTGLGLPTSRRLIELQRGSLTLENPGARGASFVFTLPLAS